MKTLVWILIGRVPGLIWVALGLMWLWGFAAGKSR